MRFSFQLLLAFVPLCGVQFVVELIELCGFNHFVMAGDDELWRWRRWWGDYPSVEPCHVYRDVAVVVAMSVSFLCGVWSVVFDWCWQTICDMHSSIQVQITNKHSRVIEPLYGSADRQKFIFSSASLWFDYSWVGFTVWDSSSVLRLNVTLKPRRGMWFDCWR